MKHNLFPPWWSLLVVLFLGHAHNGKAAEFVYPLAVAVDKQGAIFVADRKLPGIWKITNSKPEIYYQGSKKFRTPLNAVRCLAMDSDGKLLAGDSSTREVYRFSDQGKPIPLTKGKIGIPMAIAVHKTGQIYIADLETRSIVKVPAKGGAPEIMQTGLPVRGLAFDQDANLLVVAHGKDQLLQIGPDKKLKVMIKGRVFQFPHQVTLDAEGTCFVADGYAKTIWKIAKSGEKPEAFIKHPDFKNPVGLAYHDKKLYIADPQAKSLFIFNDAAKLEQRIPNN